MVTQNFSKENPDILCPLSIEPKLSHSPVTHIKSSIKEWTEGGVKKSYVIMLKVVFLNYCCQSIGDFLTCKKFICEQGFTGLTDLKVINIIIIFKGGIRSKY